MTVAGYDSEYIYLNDATDPDKEDINLPVKIANFRTAWEKTAIPQEGKGSPVGPYWMLYFSGTDNEKSADEIIAWNMEVAEQVPSDIREFSANYGDPIDAIQGLRTLAIGRLRFADFLDENGYEEAAALYRESGNLFAILSEGGGSISEGLNAIANKEEQAIGLLKAAD